MQISRATGEENGAKDALGTTELVSFGVRLLFAPM
jgi:hypothetical protein